MTSQSTMNDIIQAIDRYRIARVDLLLGHLPMESQEKFLRTLSKHNSFDLCDAADGITCVNRRSSKQPNALSIAKFIAIHSCCGESSNRRRLLLKDDIEKYFPSLARVGLPFGYTIDLSSEQPVLSLLRVDTRLDTVSRIRQEGLAILKRHSRQPAFNVLIRRNQFEVCFIVPTAAKVQSILVSLPKRNRATASINAIHVPVLLELLKPLQLTENSPT